MAKRKQRPGLSVPEKYGDLDEGKNYDDNSKKPSFFISQETYRMLPLEEKKQADLLLEKGEWVIINSLDDDAREFLLVLLMKDCLKSGFFKSYLENFLENYRQEHPQNYENLIRIIGKTMIDAHFSKKDLEIYVKCYYESLRQTCE